MSVVINYKGEEILSVNTDTTKTLKTSGKYCESDIEVINTQDGGITPSGNINITDTNVTDVTNYATAQVVDADLIAENIKKDVNILGIVGSFEGGGGNSISGSFVATGTSYSMAIPYDNYAIQYYLDPLDAATLIATTSGTYGIRFLGIYNPNFYPPVADYTAVSPTITGYGNTTGLYGERYRNGAYQSSFVSGITAFSAYNVSFTALCSGCKYYYKIWELA